MDRSPHDTSNTSILIVANGDPERLASGADRLFPDAAVLVPADKRADYLEAGVDTDRLIHVPPHLTRSGVYGHALQASPSNVVVFVDDGVTAIESITGWTPAKYGGRGVVTRAIENVITIAYEMGAPVFGFRFEPPSKGYLPQQPIRFTMPVDGNLIGFIGRSVVPEDGYSAYDGLYASVACMDQGRPVVSDTRFRMIGMERDAVGPLTVARERKALVARYPDWLSIDTRNDGTERLKIRQVKIKPKKGKGGKGRAA